MSHRVLAFCQRKIRPLRRQTTRSRFGLVFSQNRNPRPAIQARRASEWFDRLSDNVWLYVSGGSLGGIDHVKYRLKPVLRTSSEWLPARKATPAGFKTQSRRGSALKRTLRPLRLCACNGRPRQGRPDSCESDYHSLPDSLFQLFQDLNDLSW